MTIRTAIEMAAIIAAAHRIRASLAATEGLPLTGRQMAAQRAFARVVAQCRFGASPV